METKTDWEKFSRTYSAEDIFPETIIAELVCSGMACSPVAFAFWFLIPDIEAVPQFQDALAEISASDGEEESAIKDEVTKVMSLQEFLADEKNQGELLEDYNWMNKQPLPAGYKFKILGDEAVIAAAINAHNSNQF